MFSPLALGLIIQSAYMKLSYGALLGLFVAYSALMGVSLSVIFLVYDLPTLASTFFVSAGAFAGMAILGYTTKTSLCQRFISKFLSKLASVTKEHFTETGSQISEDCLNILKQVANLLRTSKTSQS